MRSIQTIGIEKPLLAGLLAGLFAGVFATGCATSEVGDAPGSLRGTVPDGALHQDAAGNFVADDDAIRFFDYFLTAEGELSVEALQALVVDEVNRRLSGTAATQAVDAFIRYSEYREEAETAARTGDPRAVVAELHRLHAAFVADFPALADEPMRFERALALRQTLGDRGLSRAERAATLARIDAELTPRREAQARARARDSSRVHLRLRAAEAELTRTRRADGSRSARPDPDGLRSLRAAHVGPAAAERLAELDRERARWQRRLRDYRAERDRLLAEIVAPAERAAALAALRDRHFDGRERLRVDALDRLAESAGPR